VWKALLHFPYASWVPCKISYSMALVAVLVTSTSGTALAQDQDQDQDQDNPTPSAQTAPRSLLQPDYENADRQSQSIELPNSPGRDDRVTASDLDAVGTQIFGVLEPRDGGFGYDLWRGSRLKFIVQLMDFVPEGSPGTGGENGRVRQDLRTRLLLSRAFDPAEVDRFSGAPGALRSADQIPFVTLRATKLLATGHLREAERALDQADAPLMDLHSLRLRSEIFLLTQRTRSACAIAARTRDQSMDPWWVRLRAFCYSVAGDNASARLTADLLAETGYEDPLFFAALGNKMDKTDIAYEAMPVRDSIHFGLLAEAANREADTNEAGDSGFPPGLVNSASTGLQMAAFQLARMIARSQPDLLDIQIPLGEAGVLAGTLRAEDLARLYEAVVMSEIEADRLLSGGASAPVREPEETQQAKRSAAIHQRMIASVMPFDRADLLSLAWDDAVAQDRRQLFIALYGRILGALPVDPAQDIHAADFAAASLLAGDYTRAARWLELLSSAQERLTSGSGDDIDAAAFGGLQAALQLVAPQVVRGSPWAAQPWNAAVRLNHGLQSGRPHQALLEVRLFQALGGRLDSEAKAALAALPADADRQTRRGTPAHMPVTGILSGLDAAARAGRKGETVLLTLLALGGPQGDSKSAQIPIIVTARCVSALVRTGFITEAKSLAIESLLADL
jgi:hypothetical protein